MLSLSPSELPITQLHGYLLGSVGPRPIAFASTIDKNGNHNLAPFSFFNVFSANPPIAIFSPARRGRDNTTKHTYENVKEVPEAVINIVNYSIVQQQPYNNNLYTSFINHSSINVVKLNPGLLLPYHQSHHVHVLGMCFVYFRQDFWT